MSGSSPGSLRSTDVAVGDELPAFELALTSTMVVAGAIASRDFMPVHHDPSFATSRGAPDIFLNILTTNGYVSRYITDWAGPEARIRKIAVRLGAPAVPGKPLQFSGNVVATRKEGGECIVDVAIRLANELGDHATGTVVVSLPTS